MTKIEIIGIEPLNHINLVRKMDFQNNIINLLILTLIVCKIFGNHAIMITILENWIEFV